jgi:hypothetical protein
VPGPDPKAEAGPSSMTASNAAQPSTDQNLSVFHQRCAGSLFRPTLCILQVSSTFSILQD